MIKKYTFSKIILAFFVEQEISQREKETEGSTAGRKSTI